MIFFWIRNVTAYFVCAIASVAVVRWIESSVVVDVLVPNLTATVVALLAINVQTTAVIAVKLRELVDRHSAAFGRTVREFRLAIFEQAFLVVLSLALSALVKSKLPVISPLAVDVAAFFIAYASLHIFLDTTVGLLTALFPEDEGAK
jgi:hypothetical protein